MKKNTFEGTFIGKRAIKALKRSPEYKGLPSQAKVDAEDELEQGGSVTLGEERGEDLNDDGNIDSEDYLAARKAAIKKAIAKKAKAKKAKANESTITNEISFEDYLMNHTPKTTNESDESALNKIQSLESGDKVQYLGASYEVIENDGFTLKLKSNEGKNINVNYNMFQQKGNIPENYSFGLQKPPQKYQGPSEIDYEGEMAKSDLLKMKKYAMALCDMIDDETQLEAWVQAKLTKASDYMSAVYHYLDYQRSNQ